MAQDGSFVGAGHERLGAVGVFHVDLVAEGIQDPFFLKDSRREPQRSQLRQLRAHRAEHAPSGHCRARTLPRVPRTRVPYSRSVVWSSEVIKIGDSGRRAVIRCPWVAQEKAHKTTGRGPVLFGSLLRAAGAFGAPDEEELGQGRALSAVRASLRPERRCLVGMVSRPDEMYRRARWQGPTVRDLKRAAAEPVIATPPGRRAWARRLWRQPHDGPARLEGRTILQSATVRPHA